MKAEIKYLLITSIIVVILSTVAYFIGQYIGGLNSQDKQLDKELIKIRKEKEILIRERDSLNNYLVHKFTDIGNKHKQDSLAFVKETKRYQDEIKKLKYEKQNRNFRVIGIDSTVNILSNFIPKKSN